MILGENLSLLEQIKRKVRVSELEDKETGDNRGLTVEKILRDTIKELEKKSTAGLKANQVIAHQVTILNFKQALEEYKEEQKNKKKGGDTIEMKQGTARQLALAFSYMVKAKHLPKGTLDYSKNAQFLEFLTGKGYENVRKKLGSIKNGQVSGIASEKEMKSLINDLAVVRNIFDTVYFKEEVKQIDNYLKLLVNDLQSLSE
jgi:hypothetical protein